MMQADDAKGRVAFSALSVVRRRVKNARFGRAQAHSNIDAVTDAGTPYTIICATRPPANGVAGQYGRAHRGPAGSTAQRSLIMQITENGLHLRHEIRTVMSLTSLLF